MQNRLWRLAIWYSPFRCFLSNIKTNTLPGVHRRLEQKKERPAVLRPYNLPIIRAPFLPLTGLNTQVKGIPTGGPQRNLSFRQKLQAADGIGWKIPLFNQKSVYKYGNNGNSLMSLKRASYNF